MGATTPAFLAGIGVGLAVAAPIGPMGLLCIQRTLGGGFGAGLATGLGAATIQAAFGAAVLIGLGASASIFLGSGAQALSILSGAFLAYFAVRILRRSVVLRRDIREAGPDLRHVYGCALAVALANPLSIVLLLAAIPALSTNASSGDAPQMLLGMFAGSVAWWIVLSGTVALVRSRLTDRALGWINTASGLALATLAVMTLFGAVLPGP